MVVSSFAVGALAWPVFKLGFVDSLLTILFFNLLGILPVAFFSSLGPWFGLRQVTLSRFYFGYYVVKFSESSNQERNPLVLNTQTKRSFSYQLLQST